MDRLVLTVALPMKMVAAMVQRNAALMNVRLVVLIVPFKVNCRPIDTVSVLTGRAGVISVMPLWNLVVDRTLGQYICLCCLLAFDADRFT